jgi:flagellar protein FlbD
MIQLHRLNGAEVVVNAEIIESVEAHPDTVIQTATGNRFVVKESVSEVIKRVVEYRKTVYVNAPYVPEFLKGEGGRLCL